MIKTLTFVRLIIISCFFWGTFTPTTIEASEFSRQITKASKERLNANVIYDGAYVALDYPGGDVASNKGVCTDVIIRTYRALGSDLQVLVHEDIRDNFSLYPSKKIWGLSRPDKNIDHRRVPNLQTFFSRFGVVLNVSDNAADYSAGDLVTWMLPGNLPHIGIVVDKMSKDGLRPLIVHNIGQGPVMDDNLFRYPITGHYRFVPEGFVD